MEILIVIYFCSLTINLLAVNLMEHFRWSILEEVGQNQTKMYFEKAMKKDIASYLIWLQLLVVIPFYGLFVSLLFATRFNKEFSKGKSNRLLCLLKTHKDYQ